MIKFTCIFLLLLRCSQLFCQNEELCFYNAQNEQILLQENSIVIICSQLNCKGCFTFLKSIHSKQKSKTKWYCLFDFSNVEPSARNRLIGNIETSATIPEIEYIFLDQKSKTTMREKIGFCKNDQTPHLVAMKSSAVVPYCHNVLFDQGYSARYFAKKIDLFFSNKK